MMTGAVLVLYNPNWDITLSVIESLKCQVDKLCIVDNSPNIDNSKYINDFGNCNYIPLRKNIGIAAAQNIGIQYLMNCGCDLFIFSDQDSNAPTDIISILISGYNVLHKNGVRIAAVGTRAYNKQTGLPYPSKSKEIGTPIETADSTHHDITECYSVRSSISLIPRQSLIEIGGFDESLFIDGVDHEWCWRAWHKQKLRSFIIENAKIDHMLGEGDRKIFGKSIAVSSPFRIYYQFRNYLKLSRRDYTPSSWKKENGKKYFIKSIYYPLIVSPQLKYIKNIFKGLIDGFKSDKPHWSEFK